MNNQFYEDNHKYYLKDLTDEELEKVWKANERLQKSVYDIVYEDNMFAQQREGETLIPTKYVEICNNYSSFYLRLRSDDCQNGYKFFNNIDFKEYEWRGMLSLKEIEDIKNLMQKYEKAYNEDTDNYDICSEYEDKLTDKAKELIERVEDDLHCYENVEEDECLNYFFENTDMFDDCYIKNKDDYKLYRDVAYTECLA